jgi:hypothetical protein
MQYLALIYTEEKMEAGKTPEELQQLLADYNAFTAEAQKAGVMIRGDALRPTDTATTVRVRGGKMLTTDGPFAETKEQLGGYYLLECKDLDEALHWAAKIPNARDGSIEVRPIVVWE